MPEAYKKAKKRGYGEAAHKAGTLGSRLNQGRGAAGGFKSETLGRAMDQGKGASGGFVRQHLGGAMNQGGKKK